MQGAAQALGEQIGWQVGQLVQGIHQALAQLGRTLTRGAHQFGIEAFRYRLREELAVHGLASRGRGMPACRNLPSPGYTHASCQPFPAARGLLSR
ncbi:hypothetical protein D3C81_1972610 [compost metagenome]